MSGENHNDNDDVREALDVILPQENVHSHVDRQNGQESVYEEPLQESAYEEPLLSESESDYDYPQSNRKYFKKEFDKRYVKAGRWRAHQIVSRILYLRIYESTNSFRKIFFDR